MKLKPLDWDGETKVSFLIFTIKTLLFVGYLAILILDVTKRQTLLPSLH